MSELEELRAKLRGVTWGQMHCNEAFMKDGEYFYLVMGRHLGKTAVAVVCRTQFVAIKYVKVRYSTVNTSTWHVPISPRIAGPVSNFSNFFNLFDRVEAISLKPTDLVIGDDDEY